MRIRQGQQKGIVYVDTATGNDGQFVVTDYGLEASVVVLARVNTHLSFSIMGWNTTGSMSWSSFSVIEPRHLVIDYETFFDECLILLHRVMIPPLGTVLSPRGVLCSLHILFGLHSVH